MWSLQSRCGEDGVRCVCGGAGVGENKDPQTPSLPLSHPTWVPDHPYTFLTLLHTYIHLTNGGSKRTFNYSRNYSRRSLQLQKRKSPRDKAVTRTDETHYQLEVHLCMQISWLLLHLSYEF